MENIERKRQGDVKEPVQDRNSKTEEDEENVFDEDEAEFKKSACQ